MKRSFCAAIAAALAFCGTVASADTKKGAAKSSFAAIQIECFKQNGGWYDEATKRWVIQAPYYHMGGKSDAINSCIAQRTGKAGQYVHEQTVRP
jgi:hypothetical protein